MLLAAALGFEPRQQSFGMISACGQLSRAVILLAIKGWTCRDYRLW
jgi:hypothetical protein